MFRFNRGINSDFVKRLNTEFENKGWWHNIATDQDLFVAIRDGYLNVYFKGNSLLKLTFQDGVLSGAVHYKYLLRPDVMDQYVQINNGTVGLSEAGALALLQTNGLNVSDMKKAANAYAGDEKNGVHDLISSNPNVIDTEITFGVSGNEERVPSTRRIDFSALRPTKKGAEVVLYEAKLFANKEVRAKDQAPPVCEQIERYQDLLDKHAKDVVLSYRAVCGNLVALNGVRDRYSSSLELMGCIASGETALHTNNAVRLVIFGFDKDQAEGKRWQPHYEKLKDKLGDHLLLTGKPKGFKRGISAPL